MAVRTGLIGNDIDFIKIYSDRNYYYYWYEAYDIKEQHYLYMLNSYLTRLKDIKTDGKFLDRDLQMLIKLKMIIKKEKNKFWDFPIVMFNDNVRCGTGRSVVDRYINKVPNQQTILITDKKRPNGIQLHNFSQLREKINLDFSVSVQDGIIISLQRGDYEFRRQQDILLGLNKESLIKEIKNLPEINLDTFISFVKSETLIYE